MKTIYALLILMLSVGATVPQHLADARQLVNEIQQAHSEGTLLDDDNVEFNRYGGSWGSTYIRFSDPENGIQPSNYNRCSPFVTLLLQHSYGWSWSDYEFHDPILEINKTTASPSSYRYEALIKQGIGFASELTQLDHVLPGDVITMVDVGTDDGHTGLVNAIDFDSALSYPEELEGANPDLAGTWYIELEILDSSSDDHTNDSRIFEIDGEETDTDGVGIGTMGILINDQMEVIGHTWSLPYSDYNESPNGWLNGLHSRLRLQTERAVSFGRLNLAPAEQPPMDDQPAEAPEEELSDITHEVLPPLPSGPLHLEIGLTLVNQIVNQQQLGIFEDEEGTAYNRYGGSWSGSNQIYLNLADGENPASSYSKCSSFVTLLLDQAYNWDWNDYEFYDPVDEEYVDTASPHAYRYANLIKQEIGFEQQIENLDETQSGDIIAYHDVGTKKGHAMVLIGIDWQSGIPYPSENVNATPELEGATFYEMQILDVTKSGHSLDTRQITVDDSTDKTGGAGVGVMGILVNDQMEVIGHTWSLPSHDPVENTDSWVNSLNGRVKYQENRELVFGRLPYNP